MTVYPSLLTAIGGAGDTPTSVFVAVSDEACGRFRRVFETLSAHGQPPATVLVPAPQVPAHFGARDGAGEWALVGLFTDRDARTEALVIPLPAVIVERGKWPMTVAVCDQGDNAGHDPLTLLAAAVMANAAAATHNVVAELFGDVQVGFTLPGPSGAFTG